MPPLPGNTISVGAAGCQISLASPPIKFIYKPVCLTTHEGKQPDCCGCTKVPFGKAKMDGCYGLISCIIVWEQEAVVSAS
jgi:hypothetical protein